MVHGTSDSLQKFFSDAVSRDYDVVAILSDEPEKISGANLDVFSPKNLPAFVYKLIDGIILTGDKAVKDFFLAQEIEPHKIILWSNEKGWESFSAQNPDGVQVIFINGLKLSIRNKSDEWSLNETILRLKNNRIYKNMEPRLFEKHLREHFQRRTGKPIDFDNLKTFTEKLQWLKLYDSTPLKSRLADKFAVRSWVAEKIGDEYLIPLLGVYDDFDDIDFDALPDKFVLKCNHGSGMNFVVRDKAALDRQRARERINAWLAFDYGMNVCLELHYSGINRKIIAEKFMTNGNLPDLIDYKFLCFNGKIVYCQYLTDRSTNLKLNYFDENWTPTTVERSDHPRSEHPEKISPPKNFELMKELAAKLAQGFAFVRVDFYEIDGKVYFGEMTFTPGGGDFSYKSEGTDEYLGSLLKLPEPTLAPKL